MAHFEDPINDLDARNRKEWLELNFTDKQQVEVSCRRWATSLKEFFFSRSEVDSKEVRVFNILYFHPMIFMFHILDHGYQAACCGKDVERNACSNANISFD